MLNYDIDRLNAEKIDDETKKKIALTEAEIKKVTDLKKLYEDLVKGTEQITTNTEFQNDYLKNQIVYQNQINKLNEQLINYQLKQQSTETTYSRINNKSGLFNSKSLFNLNDQLLQAQKDRIQKENELALEDVNQKMKTFELNGNLRNDLSKDEIDIYEALLQRRNYINEKYQADLEQSQDDHFSRYKQKLGENVATAVEFENQLSNLSLSILNAYYTKKLESAEGDVIEQDKINKKLFDINKAFQLSQIVINGIASVVQEFTSKDFLVALPFMAAKTLAATAAFVQVSAQQYKSTVSKKPNSTASYNASVGAAASKNILYGTESKNQIDTVTPYLSTSKNKLDNIRVFVLESDITKSQSSAAKSKQITSI